MPTPLSHIFDVGGPHTFGTIFMDAKTHPADLEPTEYGHSFGHWEGDTLVVDKVGFSEDFWLDRTGLPHTTKLHTIERFTRTDCRRSERVHAFLDRRVQSALETQRRAV